MLNSVSTITSNNHATLDAHAHQQDRANARSLSRLQRSRPRRCLAYINWNLDQSGTDTSQGVLCDENGKSRSIVVQIDAIQSIVNCCPQTFGYALYEIECVSADSSGAPIYAAVRASAIEPDSSLGTIEALASVDSSSRLVGDSGLITNVVGGSALDNYLPFCFDSGGSTDPSSYDCANPLQYAPVTAIPEACALCPSPGGPPDTIYGYVNWNYTGHGSAIPDQSQCEICNDDGSRITGPTVSYIDFLSSVRPTMFGDVYYELELIGNTTRSGASKPTYRAKQALSTITSGYGYGIKGARSAKYNGGTSVGLYDFPCTMCDTSDTAIGTLINGSYIANTLLVTMPSGTLPTSGWCFDLPVDPWWYVDGTYSIVAMRLGMYTEARPGVNVGGAMSIDRGEPVAINFTGSLTISTGNGGFVEFSGTLTMYIGNAGYAHVAGQGQFHGVYSTGSGASTTVTPIGGIIALGYSTIFTSGTAFSLGGTVGTYATIQMTITTNPTTGRITGLTLTLGSLAGSVSASALGDVIIGGRGPWWINGG